MQVGAQVTAATEAQWDREGEDVGATATRRGEGNEHGEAAVGRATSAFSQKTKNEKYIRWPAALGQRAQERAVRAQARQAHRHGAGGGENAGAVGAQPVGRHGKVRRRRRTEATQRRGREGEDVEATAKAGRASLWRRRRWQGGSTWRQWRRQQWGRERGRGGDGGTTGRGRWTWRGEAAVGRAMSAFSKKKDI